MKIKSEQNLIKKEIAYKIKKKIGFSSEIIQQITDDIIDIFIEFLINKKKINIKNFGSFVIAFKNEREGRNPKTKEKFIINSRNTIKFKASNLLKKKINQN